MVSFSAKFEGGRELDAALGEFTKGQARATLMRTLKKAGEPVRDAMQERAPVLSGTLKGNIVVGTRLTRRQARAVRKEGKDFAEVYVGTADPAGVANEFGNFKQGPQPFARSGWEASQDEALKVMQAELKTEIDKTAARIAKRAARGG